MTQITRNQVARAIYEIEAVCTPDPHPYKFPKLTLEKHGVVSFDWRGSQYSLFCSNNKCTASKWVPVPEKTAGEEVFAALLGIATLGMVGCSSLSEKEAVDVVQFADVDAKADISFSDSGSLGIKDATSEVVKNDKCMDSDGENILKGGLVIENLGTPEQKKYVDICKDSAFIYEQTCGENGKRKQMVFKCSDISSDYICIDDAVSGAKCDLASNYFDAGSQDVAKEDALSSQDAVVETSVESDVPPVDYLKNNPLPLALDVELSSDYNNLICYESKSFVGKSKLSQCIYLKALFDINGNPIITSSYTDVLQKISDNSPFVLAIVEGDNEYPKTSTGKMTAYKTGKPSSIDDPKWFVYFNSDLQNGPLMHSYINEQKLVVEYYEKPSPEATIYMGCFAVYWAPNGFSNCAKK